LLCREFFESFPEPLLGDLINFLDDKNESPETAYAFLSQKIIEANINSDLINHDSSIKLKNQFPNFQRGRIAA
ncbi:MAG: hypothetical protein ABWZ66_01495, partial [Pyrinomonadaceae bacterium]